MEQKRFTFKDYMSYLQESISQLARSRMLTGRDNQSLLRLSKALNDEDPFVSYRASKAAIALMQDKSIYH